MSHKQAKKLRQQQRMEQQQSQYSFKQIQTLIALLQLLTGTKPMELTVTETFYNWYIQEAQAQAEALGLKLGFKNDIVTFEGVKLIKKSPEIVKP